MIIPKEINGTLIAIEGIDGSGKGSQANRLCHTLKNIGYSVELYSFPRYGSSSAAKIEDYLAGRISNGLSPKDAAISFAEDRLAVKDKLWEDLRLGKVLIADRYVLSNIAHQGARVSENLRDDFCRWIFQLEYQINQLPEPDINLVLLISPNNAVNLISKKKPHTYLRDDQVDKHESNFEHLLITSQIYQKIVSRRLYGEIKGINCEKNGEILSMDIIAYEILAAVTPYLPRL